VEPADEGNRSRQPACPFARVRHAAAGWTPTVDNYLGRVTKAHMLQAVREAKGEHSAQLTIHLKKPDMVRVVARFLEGSGWLPDVLRLPIYEIGAQGNAVGAGRDEVAEDVTAESTDVERQLS
jgi:ParB family transcriptional regulator, chromosome partitioning protein